MSRFFWLFGKYKDSKNTITINKSHILYNLWFLQSMHWKSDIFPVLKWNAYGHWVLEMLRIMKRVNVPYLAVSDYEDSLLIKNNSSHNVLLLDETSERNYRKMSFSRITPCVWNLETIKILLSMKKKIIIHLFLNTWMNREWCDSDQLKLILDTIKDHPHWDNLMIEWVMSHLAKADELGADSIKEQVKLYKKMFHTVIDYGHMPIYKHIWSSAGMLKLSDWFFNARRPWVAIYGYNPLLSEDKNFSNWTWLKPALNIESTVTAVIRLKKWDSVWYWWIWTASEEWTIVTVPFGYSDWLTRSMSWKIVAYSGSKELKQVGRISMNSSSFLISEGLEVSMWDKVTLISMEKDSFNSVKSWAQATDSIPHEILVSLNRVIDRKISL